MKLLLDENLPHQLRPLLVGHEVFTVAYMNWQGIENGELLALAGKNNFDAVLTKDLGIYHQQNIPNLPCSLLLLEAKSNSIADIRPLVPAILSALITLKRNAVVRIK